MSSDSEFSDFSESSNDDENIDLVYSQYTPGPYTPYRIATRSLVHNTTSSGHFGRVIRRPFLRAKSHNFQVL